MKVCAEGMILDDFDQVGYNSYVRLVKFGYVGLVRLVRIGLLA